METTQATAAEQFKVLNAENKVVIDELKAKLRHAEEQLQIANKRMNECLHSTIVVNTQLKCKKIFVAQSQRRIGRELRNWRQL